MYDYYVRNSSGQYLGGHGPQTELTWGSKAQARSFDKETADGIAQQYGGKPVIAV